MNLDGIASMIVFEMNQSFNQSCQAMLSDKIKEYQINQSIKHRQEIADNEFKRLQEMK